MTPNDLGSIHNGGGFALFEFINTQIIGGCMFLYSIKKIRYMIVSTTWNQHKGEIYKVQNQEKSRYIEVVIVTHQFNRTKEVIEEDVKEEHFKFIFLKH